MEGDFPVGRVRCVPVPVCANEPGLRGVRRVEIGEYVVQDVVR